MPPVELPDGTIRAFPLTQIAWFGERQSLPAMPQHAELERKCGCWRQARVL